jgi:cell division protein FtsW (lipid II flippase)
MYVCMYACMCVFMYVCMHVCMCLCMYVCIRYVCVQYLHMYVYIYIYIYIHTVCIFGCMEQGGTNWTDVREILY